MCRNSFSHWQHSFAKQRTSKTHLQSAGYCAVCTSGNSVTGCCFFKFSARWIHFAWWGTRCQQGSPAAECRTSCCSSGTTLHLGWSWSVNPLQAWPKGCRLCSVHAFIAPTGWQQQCLLWRGRGYSTGGWGVRTAVVMCCPFQGTQTFIIKAL